MSHYGSSTNVTNNSKSIRSSYSSKVWNQNHAAKLAADARTRLANVLITLALCAGVIAAIAYFGLI